MAAKKRKSGKRKMNPALKAASAACRMKVKPFTKAFGKCVKAEFKKSK